jgi:Rrf2 family transcriptional regulator, iron-sulfur cluster assembly transcription factor
MIRYGKTAQTALAIMSMLAERYDGGKTVVSSLEIAKTRRLSPALVAKILTQLSTSGLVDGTRGPGGGYWLAKSPRLISLEDVVALFGRQKEDVMCPFGPGWCGKKEPCPMHEQVSAFSDEWQDYLRKTKLSIFQTK